MLLNEIHTSLNEIDIMAIQDKLAPLLSRRERVWQTLQSAGSLLSFDFGAKLSRKTFKRKPKKREREEHLLHYGEWNLWIYMCAWRIQKSDEVLASSQDDRSQVASVLKLLDRKILISVDIFSPFGDTLFTFENEVTLRTFSIDSKRTPHWKLYTPDGYVLCLGPGSRWSYRKSSEPRLTYENL